MVRYVKISVKNFSSSLLILDLTNKNSVMKKLKEVKKLGDWISKKDAMEFLGYKTTQMNQFLKDYSGHLKIARVGRRVFITVSSIVQVLELNEL